MDWNTSRSQIDRSGGFHMEGQVYLDQGVIRTCKIYEVFLSLDLFKATLIHRPGIGRMYYITIVLTDTNSGTLKRLVNLL